MNTHTACTGSDAILLAEIQRLDRRLSEAREENARLREDDNARVVLREIADLVADFHETRNPDLVEEIGILAGRASRRHSPLTPEATPTRR
jgi:hypothetical protein